MGLKALVTKVFLLPATIVNGRLGVLVWVGQLMVKEVLKASSLV